MRDYCYDFDRLAPFYCGAPTSPAAWRESITARQARPAQGGHLAEIVTAQLKAREAPPASRDAAARLALPDTVAIVTGQQAAVFGGPLFTLLKAVTEIKLARQVEADYQTRAVPVFWIDAEDHDLDEIRTCGVLDSELAFQRVSLDIKESAGRPAAAVVLEASTEDALEELGQILPQTEYSAEVLRTLSTAYCAGTRLVEAFAKWLEMLLGGHGLVVFDASDPAAKALAQPIFEQELRTHGETTRLALEAGTDLVARGYHAQVTPRAGSVALFELNDTRKPIRVERDGLSVNTASRTVGELLRQVETRPELFSPNVLLRPIVQDALFPTVAYVAGPSELAYLGQLQQIYASFDIPMPMIYPRATVTVVDRSTIKFLNRYNVSFEELQAHDDAVLNRLLEAQLPNSVDEAVSAAEAAINERLQTIETEVPVIDPTLAGVVQTTRRRMERDLSSLRGKIVQAAKRRDETLSRQFRRVRAQTFPQGNPQERVVAGVYFLNRYGPALVDRLLAEVPLALGHHWLLTG